MSSHRTSTASVLLHGARHRTSQERESDQSVLSWSSLGIHAPFPPPLFVPLRQQSSVLGGFINLRITDFPQDGALPGIPLVYQTIKPKQPISSTRSPSLSPAVNLHQTHKGSCSRQTRLDLPAHGLSLVLSFPIRPRRRTSIYRLSRIMHHN